MPRCAAVRGHHEIALSERRALDVPFKIVRAGQIDQIKFTRRREVKAKTKPKKSKKERDPNKPKVRSLHHIDDDDYDYTPPVKETEEVKTEVAGIKVEQAPTKKD